MSTNDLKLTTAISSQTYKRMVFDSGIVYRDYGLPGQTLLGATSGGSVFTIEPEFREMIVDGAPGPVKGSQRITKITAKLATNLIEITDDNIKLALPGSEATADGNGNRITRNVQISDGDYSDNITLLMKAADTDELFALQIKNALHLGSFEITAAEDTEVIIPLELTAHFDPASMDVEPWSVFNPNEEPSVTHTLTYTAGLNGSVVGLSPQIVSDGEDGTEVGAVADATYKFVDWSDASTDNPRTDLAVSADITVTANFALI